MMLHPYYMTHIILWIDTGLAHNQINCLSVGINNDM